MASGITEIIIADDLGQTPARTKRATGQVWVNRQMLHMFPMEYWEYILEHEAGHIVNDTRSEFEADQYASDRFMLRHPDKPFVSVDALQKVLPMNTKEQHERVQKQKERAAKFDCAKNGNAKSCKMIGTSTYTGNYSRIPLQNIGYAEFTVIDMLNRLGNKPIPTTASQPANVFETEPSSSRSFTGADFIKAIKMIKTQLQGYHFDNYCGAACQAEKIIATRNAAIQAKLEGQLADNNATIYTADLAYQKTLAELKTAAFLQGNQTELEKLKYQFELEKIEAEAANKQPIDLKKIGVVVLIAAAALLAIYIINSD